MGVQTIYDFEAKSISGKDLPLSQFKGQVMLIVNTASKCGFTPQFGGLEELHKTYAGKGLAVLGAAGRCACSPKARSHRRHRR